MATRSRKRYRMDVASRFATVSRFPACLILATRCPPTPRRTERAAMRKAAVRGGDATTTRGFVIGTSTRINDGGKKVALDGDEATCGNCKGLHTIIGTGKGISDKGRRVVVDGDSVLCPCKKNRVIVGSNPRIFLNTHKGSAVASSAAGSFSVASTLASSPRFAEDHDSEEPHPVPVSDGKTNADCSYLDGSKV